MAFGGKPQEAFTLVSVNDPSLDRSGPAEYASLLAYRRERADWAGLKCIVGASPTVFHCNPISHQARIMLEGEQNEARRFELAFRVAVQRVENLDLEGGPLGPPDLGGWSEGARLLSVASMDRLGAALGQVIEEIGYVALQRAQLSGHQKKTYLLPLGFRAPSVTLSSATAPTPESTSDPTSGST